MQKYKKKANTHKFENGQNAKCDKKIKHKKKKTIKIIKNGFKCKFVKTQKFEKGLSPKMLKRSKWKNERTV